MARTIISLDTFLEEYKAFERAVCGADHLENLSWIANGTTSVDSVFSLENCIPDQDTKDKIKVCRMLRNYAQHHPDAGSFLAVSAEEIAFLHQRTEEILCLNGTVKDIMIRCQAALTDKNTLADFAAAMSAKNLSVYPYKTKDGTFSLLTLYDIAYVLGNGGTAKQKITSAPMSKREASETAFVFQNTPVAALPAASVIIVLTQTKDKAIGIILPKTDQ